MPRGKGDGRRGVMRAGNKEWEGVCRKHLRGGWVWGIMPAMSEPIRPIIISISATKGGVGKSFLAQNLATYLAKEWGFGVLVADLNPNPDTYADVARVLRPMGIDTFFHVSPRRDILAPGGILSKPNIPWDIVICDTNQLIEDPVTVAAYARCHHFVMPVTPDYQDQKNFAATLQYLKLIREKSGTQLPHTLTMPNRLVPFQNAHSRKELVALLAEFRDVVHVDTPEHDGSFLDENITLKDLPARALVSDVRGKVTPKFLAKVRVNMGWLAERILARHGANIVRSGALSSLQEQPFLEADPSLSQGIAA